jgi:hypothetical protein
MASYTKDFLQNYTHTHKEYMLAKRIVDEVLRVASRGGTRFVQPITSGLGIEFSRHHTRDVDARVLQVNRFLKQMLPDSSIEYKTVERLDRSIEGGIVVDWS